MQFFTQPNNDLERNYFYSVKISLRNHLAMIKKNKYFLVEDLNMNMTRRLMIEVSVEGLVDIYKQTNK